jgi:hypothetical protein
MRITNCSGIRHHPIYDLQKEVLFRNAIESDRSCKELWKHLKDINSTGKQNITSLKKDYIYLTNITDIINHLNDHFSSVGGKLIPNPKQTFDWDKMSAFVKDKVSDDVFFSLYSVTFSDVLKELKKP